MSHKNSSTQKGFTLLELIVVVAVLGLITSMATEYIALNTNQQRFETTKKRIEILHKAIVGTSGFSSDGNPFVTGSYLSDMGEIPAELRFLLVEDYCSDAQYFNQTDCTNNSGTWTDRPSWNASQQKGWRGPYIRHADQQDGVAIFPDGWGKANVELVDFGWNYVKVTDDKGTPDTSDDTYTWTLQSYGLDFNSGTVSTSDADEYVYEQDYPADANAMFINTTDYRPNSAKIKITTGEICSIKYVDGSSLESLSETISDPKNHSVSFNAGNHQLDIRYDPDSNCSDGNTSDDVIINKIIPVPANIAHTVMSIN